MAPQRARDYRREEERRNAKARELGFSSRAQMRRALREESFVPVRKGRAITGRAEGPVFPAFAKSGFTTEGDYRKARREAAAWSKAHSQSPYSAYSSKLTGPQFRAYYDAFVNPTTRANRIENGLASLRHWLVDEQGYYQPEEFDDKYRGEL